MADDQLPDDLNSLVFDTPVTYDRLQLSELFCGDEQAIQLVLTLQSSGVTFGVGHRRSEVVLPDWLASTNAGRDVAESFNICSLQVLTNSVGVPVSEPTHMVFTLSKQLPSGRKVDASAAMAATSANQMREVEALVVHHGAQRIAAIDVVIYNKFRFELGMISPGEQFHEAGRNHALSVFIGDSREVGFSSKTVAQWVRDLFSPTDIARERIHGAENYGGACTIIQSMLDGVKATHQPEISEA